MYYIYTVYVLYWCVMEIQTLEVWFLSYFFLCYSRIIIGEVGAINSICRGQTSCVCFLHLQ